MTLVDAHHHLWDPADGGYAWQSADGLEPLRRPFTVDDLAGAAPDDVIATVVVEADASHAETVRLLATAAAHDQVAGVVGWVDLLAPDVDDVLAALRDGPGGGALVGVRHQVQSERDPAWLARSDVHRGLAAVRRHDLCFDLVLRPEHLPAATVAARAVPGLRLVLDHLGKPAVATRDHEAWRTALVPFAAVEGTTAKVSGLVTEADRKTWRPEDLLPFVTTAFELFGADRLMFGSDWPVCTLAAAYVEVVDAYAWCLERLGVSGSERAAVDRTTAATSYRLEIP